MVGPGGNVGVKCAGCLQVTIKSSYQAIIPAAIKIKSTRRAPALKCKTGCNNE